MKTKIAIALFMLTPWMAAFLMLWVAKAPARQIVSSANAAVIVRTATATGCTTTANSFANCDVTLTWSNGGFTDTSYFFACSVVDTNLQASGGDGSTGDVPGLPVRSFSTTQITATIQTEAARAISSANTTVKCIGIHP